MPPAPFQDSETALEAYCGELRLALRHLLDALSYEHLPLPESLRTVIGIERFLSPEWAIEDARNVLAMDIGWNAEQMLTLMAQLNGACYILADEAHWRLYGTPRGGGTLPSQKDLREALRQVEVLTHQMQALEQARETKPQEGRCQDK